MGDLDGIEGGQWCTSEWGSPALGVVDDPAKPAFVFERPDATRVTVDLTATDEASWAEELGIVGDLVGTAPEAVARRTEAAWTRLDKATKTFLLSYNDYEAVLLPKAIAAMEAALDDGSATRVDMRYLRGGNGSLAQPLIDALAGDARINRPGGLTVLIGRENVSAGTIADRRRMPCSMAFALRTWPATVTAGAEKNRQRRRYASGSRSSPLGRRRCRLDPEDEPPGRVGELGDERYRIERREVFTARSLLVPTRAAARNRAAISRGSPDIGVVHVAPGEPAVDGHRDDHGVPGGGGVALRVAGLRLAAADVAARGAHPQAVAAGALLARCPGRRRA